ncbi:oxidative damage protection protein [Sodalis sp. CWE]|uniref:oxidative damage protection protein n=1 Tax=Sodalis sp. CWE TaxID=2803816 RepID=UPI001C7E13EC|nr:oxidative damage protection protein [Sodalis sp. CWE]MBX4180901.1 oxidative damage protection protein [Sodalis sp. CWE]
MKRKIYCTFLKQKAEGQEIQCYPGELGKRIYDNISAEAWAKWQTRQTIMINEKKLNMLDSLDRKFLEEEMIRFLFKN